MTFIEYLQNANLINIKKLNKLVFPSMTLLLLVTIVSVFVPLSPLMPWDNLDGSWRFSLNQAFAQGLAFGDEIVFQLGPYASIWTTVYHPSTDFIMLLGSSYLALSYFIMLVFLMIGINWRWIIFFCFLFASFIYSRDSLLFSYPLLLSLVSLRLISGKDNLFKTYKSSTFLLVFLFIPLGLFPLIKGSMILLSTSFSILCSAFFSYHNKKSFAAISLIIPILSTMIFWILAGQALSNLPNYFILMSQFISGYTEAMAMNGNVLEILLYVVSSVSILIAILIQTHITIIGRLFLISAFTIFLFLAFKAGFVRHDGHAVISSTSILLALIALYFVGHYSKFLLALTIIPIIACSYININNISTLNYKTHVIRNDKDLNCYPSCNTDFVSFLSAYISAWDGLKNRINDSSGLEQQYNQKISSIKERVNYPDLQGTTDIYSYKQMHLIASNYDWNPRPIFQSYQAVTALLAEKNKKHLVSSNRPDNIIFRVESIDNRFPSLDDGASWPTLLHNYIPSKMEQGALFLKKKKHVIQQIQPVEIAEKIYSLGQSVKVPNLSQPIFVSLDIKPSLLGYLANILLKTSHLQMNIELLNGTQKQYLLIAGMSKSGFIISPLVENTTEFLFLFDTSGNLNQKVVKSFSISHKYGMGILWQDQYTVRFSTI